MRTKDSYQEHMIGYLSGVQLEIEALERSRIPRRDVISLYLYLDLTVEHLWQVIRANDTDWEEFRFNLEANCDDLLRAVYRALRRKVTTRESAARRLSRIDDAAGRTISPESHAR